jgi:hypothetical protein
MFQTLMMVLLVSSPSPTVEDLSWLAGHWRGEGLGGSCEEIWSEPLAGTMVGTFRLVEDGETRFYEMLVLAREETGLVMKVKHFAPDLVGWEEKEDFLRFELERVEPNRAHFEGLSMEREGDRLEIRVIRYKGGEVREESIVLQRYEGGDRHRGAASS